MPGRLCRYETGLPPRQQKKIREISQENNSLSTWKKHSFPNSLFKCFFAVNNLKSYAASNHFYMFLCQCLLFPGVCNFYWYSSTKKWQTKPCNTKTTKIECHPRQCKIRWQNFQRQTWCSVIFQPNILVGCYVVSPRWGDTTKGSLDLLLIGFQPQKWIFSMCLAGSDPYLTTVFWIVGLFQIFRGRIQLTYIEAKIHLLSTRRTCQ